MTHRFQVSPKLIVSQKYLIFMSPEFFKLVFFRSPEKERRRTTPPASAPPPCVYVLAAVWEKNKHLRVKGYDPERENSNRT